MDPTAHPPGTVGILAGYDARYTGFYQAVMGTAMPPGTAISWAVGVDVVTNSNRLVEGMLENPASEWLWILGDDHSWAPGALVALLDHNVDVVVPLVLSKAAPYRPVAFEALADADANRYYPLQLQGRKGLVPVAAAGTAGMLVRRHVFEAIPPPWFKLPRGNMAAHSEDVYFCQLAVAAGYELHCDLDVSMGHIAPGTIRAVRDSDGTWCHEWEIGGGGASAPMPDAIANPQGRPKLHVVGNA